ncbi:MAG: response regulator transcription factor [Candidatus Methylomirabilis oxygeniifera]|uniref:Two component transcriptional regulator, LuxR family n=1 Tax=Methylomirabilis oxygeniifera TaxID=671143 RepID=D5MIE5_METO1|nr:MAG: response regulator transcription factor [Candidatus Methylomirabilis oxyfera]CBE67295.1 Two component transcriptional regulator, LuxR family [Candidatus Methylomirabilis oxyfera]
MDLISVIIADDHTLSREGLRLLLAQEPTISVVGAADSDQAISMAEALQPDIVLLAVNIQELSALNALSLIRKKSPRTDVLILSGCPDDELMSAALQLGAKGYVSKMLSHKDLVKAIRVVHAGEIWAGRKVLAGVLESLRHKTHETNRSFSETQEALTDREQEIVGWVIQGMTNKEIAARLEISDKTVKAHLSNIFSKLKISRRLELALHQIVGQSD